MLYQHLVTGYSSNHFFLSFAYILRISHGILKHVCGCVCLCERQREMLGNLLKNIQKNLNTTVMFQSFGSFKAASFNVDCVIDI